MTPTKPQQLEKYRDLVSQQRQQEAWQVYREIERTSQKEEDPIINFRVEENLESEVEE